MAFFCFAAVKSLYRHTVRVTTNYAGSICALIAVIAYITAAGHVDHILYLVGLFQLLYQSRTESRLAV